jgi:hypothetical protein
VSAMAAPFCLPSVRADLCLWLKHRTDGIGAN